MTYNIHAFSFEIQTIDDIWYVFCTPMISDNKAVTIDLWCPENPIFSGKKSFLLNEDIVGAVQNYIYDIVRKNNLNNSSLKLLSNEKNF